MEVRFAEDVFGRFVAVPAQQHEVVVHAPGHVVMAGEILAVLVDLDAAGDGPRHGDRTTAARWSARFPYAPGSGGRMAAVISLRLSEPRWNT